ncbi:MAG: C39 family peptidase [Clostridiales bacterium]|nr:C39 family peptidase [Clostridiales bacterium]
MTPNQNDIKKNNDIINENATDRKPETVAENKPTQDIPVRPVAPPRPGEQARFTRSGRAAAPVRGAAPGNVAGQDRSGNKKSGSKEKKPIAIPQRNRIDNTGAPPQPEKPRNALKIKNTASAALAAALLLSNVIYFASSGAINRTDVKVPAEDADAVTISDTAELTPDTTAPLETEPVTEEDTTIIETTAETTTEAETAAPETTAEETTAETTTEPETTAEPEPQRNRNVAWYDSEYSGTINSATGGNIDVRIDYKVSMKAGDSEATISAVAYLDFLNLNVRDTRIGVLKIANVEKEYSTGAIKETDRARHSIKLASLKVSAPIAMRKVEISANWELGGNYGGHYIGNIVAKGFVEITDEYETIPKISTLDVKNVLQIPELPNGCEITSLTILINHLGFDVDKLTMADKLLDKVKPYTDANPYNENAGDPRDAVKSYGCYAPVIYETAVKYFSNIVPAAGDTTIYSPKDLTGTQPRELYKMVAAGNPIVVWVTRQVDTAPEILRSWTALDGTHINWKHPSHTVVLTGYDYNAGTVTICDPLYEGAMKISMELFELRYIQMGAQAVAITVEAHE